MDASPTSFFIEEEGTVKPIGGCLNFHLNGITLQLWDIRQII